MSTDAAPSEWATMCSSFPGESLPETVMEMYRSIPSTSFSPSSLTLNAQYLR